MYHLAANAISRHPRQKSIEGYQVDDDIPTLNVQRNNKNILAVVCTVSQVEILMPAEAFF